MTGTLLESASCSPPDPQCRIARANGRVVLESSHLRDPARHKEAIFVQLHPLYDILVEFLHAPWSRPHTYKGEHSEEVTFTISMEHFIRWQ